MQKVVGSIPIVSTKFLNRISKTLVRFFVLGLPTGTAISIVFAPHRHKIALMRNELQTLPSAASQCLESKIRPDESVLFAGQPVARGFNGLTKILFLSALFVLIGYPLMLNTVVAELGASWQWIKWLLYAFFALSIPMCIALMSSPFLLKRLRKQAAFVLTDRRVIVLKALPFYSKIQSFGIEPGLIESVCLHRDGSGDLLLASESGRGWLRDIPQLKQFVAALGRLGVQEPSSEKYAEYTLRTAQQGLIKQSLILAALAIFCLLLNPSVNTADALRANGVRTEAKIVGISEEKSSGGRGSQPVYRPIVLFSTPDGQKHWQKLGHVDGIYLVNDDYNRPASIGKSVEIVYNPADVSELVVAENTDRFQQAMIRYIRNIAVLAIIGTALMLLGDIRAWLFGQRIKRGEI